MLFQKMKHDNYLGYTSATSGIVPSRAISSSMRGLTPCCTISMETLRALRMATGVELPCAMMVTPLTPRRGLPLRSPQKGALSWHGMLRRRAGSSNHTERVCLKFLFQPFAESLGGSLACFQQDVSGKTVCQSHIYFMFKKIVAFHISYDLKGSAPRSSKCFNRQKVPLVKSVPFSSSEPLLITPTLGICLP